MEFLEATQGKDVGGSDGEVFVVSFDVAEFTVTSDL